MGGVHDLDHDGRPAVPMDGVGDPGKPGARLGEYGAGANDTMVRIGPR